MAPTQQDVRDRSMLSPPWPADVGGALAAIVCALVTWGSARLADVDLLVERGGEVQEVGAEAVALVAGISALVGLAVLRLLERRTPRGLQLWTGLALGVALASLLGPLSATTAAGTGALLSLHGVVAAVIITSAHASRRRHHTAD